MNAEQPQARVPLYLEDIAVGQRYATESITVTAEAIKAFAAEFDPQPFHLDADAAQATLFGGLAASGWHTSALTMRLLVTSGPPVAGGLIGLGGEIEWPRPTRPGDTLTVECEVLAVTPSRSKPDRGIVVMRNRTLNQHSETVQVAVVKVLAKRRPSAPLAAR